MAATSKPTVSISGWAASGVTPSSLPSGRVGSGMLPGETLPAAIFNLMGQYSAIVDDGTFVQPSSGPNVVNSVSVLLNFIEPTRTLTPPSASFPSGYKGSIGVDSSDNVRLSVWTNDADPTDLIIEALDTGASVTIAASGGSGPIELSGSDVSLNDGPIYVTTTDASGVRYGYGATLYELARTAHVFEGAGSGTFSYTDDGMQVGTGNTAYCRVVIAKNESGVDGYVEIGDTIAPIFAWNGSAGSAGPVDISLVVDGATVQAWTGVDPGDTLTVTGAPIALDANEVAHLLITIAPSGGTIDFTSCRTLIATKGVL